MGRESRANPNSFKKKIGTLKPKVNKLDRVIVHSTRVLANDIKEHNFTPARRAKW